MHVCTMHIVCERAPTHVLCTSAVNIIEDLRGAKEGNLAGGESAPPTMWGGVSNTKQICLLSGGDKDFQTNPPVQCGHKTDDGGVFYYREPERVLYMLRNDREGDDGTTRGSTGSSTCARWYGEDDEDCCGERWRRRR